jgi:hypothetical protein
MADVDERIDSGTVKKFEEALATYDKSIQNVVGVFRIGTICDRLMLVGSVMSAGRL